MAELTGYQQRIKARKLWEANNRPPQQAAPQAQGAYTVKDEDTLAAIAEANGLSVDQLMANNPMLTQLRPGTVLDVRNRQLFPGERRDVGGFGVPTAGPVGAVNGGLATGVDNFKAQYMPLPVVGAGGLGSGVNTGQKQPVSTFQSAVQAAIQPGQPSIFQQATGALQGLGLYRPGEMSTFQTATGALKPVSTTAHQEIRPGQVGLASPPPSLQADLAQQARDYQRMLASRQSSYGNYFKKLVANLETGYTPTNLEFDWLVQTGLIQRAGSGSTAGGGGFGGYGGRRGGGGRGGRGGGGSGGGGGYVSRPRGFSSGAAVHGLVNWRI